MREGSGLNRVREREIKLGVKQERDEGREWVK